jgi:hypothetical protein
MNNGDDFDDDDFLNEDEFVNSEGFTNKMQEFHDKMRNESMAEAYRFISDVGILFWVRNDQFVKKSRKLNILNKMVSYFQGLEEYEKCAYLMKGVNKLSTENEETKESV